MEAFLEQQGFAPENCRRAAQANIQQTIQHRSDQQQQTGKAEKGDKRGREKEKGGEREGERE
jgi:hypothetical protein